LTTKNSPERIVSFAPNLTEILFALGLGDRIVAVSSNCDWPVEARTKPKVGTFWQPNIEAVISARPDLVITLAFEQQRNLAQRLKRIGYSTLTVNIEKVNGLFDAIEKIGEATAAQSQANQLVSHIKKKLDELSISVGKDHRIRVLYVVQRQPLRVAGRDTFINEMIELAGGENAIGPTVHKYPPIGAEQVYACRADVIIEPTMGQKNLTAQQDSALEYWSKFENVPAVANKRIYVIDGDIVARLGPRLYQAVETIAKCLRPELFEN
jgi:iron complex transport system substrate-binding protein